MPIERVAIVILIGLLVLAAVLIARRRAAKQFARLEEVGPDWRALGAQPDGRRTVIAFSTPSCAACHKAQAPAIDRLRQQLGTEAFRVIKVDAAQQPDAAKAFGILTVPSTIVIKANGNEIVALNHGFAPSSQLAAQLLQAS